MTSHNLFTSCLLTNFRMLFPARVISGIGTGYVGLVIKQDFWLTQWLFYSITLQACPLYVAEIAPKEVRGIMVSMVNVVGASGLVVRQNSYCNYVEVTHDSHSVRDCCNHYHGEIPIWLESVNIHTNIV